jgi:hypothetical protein
MRTPRCTYGWDTSGSLLTPTVPTTAPSTTAAPRAAAMEPRCVNVTAYPSAVAIVTLFPDDGTVPAKVMVPVAGASTVAPGSPPTSIPRCWPAAYGCAGSKRKGCRTAPVAGHVQAWPTGTNTSAARTAASS